MLVFKIGNEFPVPDIITTDGARLEIECRSIMAVITCTGLTTEEIKSFNSAPFRIALVEFDDVFFLVCNTGKTGWWEMPYSASFYPTEAKQLILTEGEMRYPLLFVLVENFTKTVVAMRLVQLSLEFSARIKQAVDKQTMRIMDKSQYQRLVAKYYRTFKTPDEFLSHATMQFETHSEAEDSEGVNVIVL